MAANNASQGYFRLPRSVRSLPFWATERFCRAAAWIDLCLEARYSDQTAVIGAEVITVKAGQALISQAALSRRWGWDRKTQRRFFSVLTRLNLIRIDRVIRGDNGCTLITIIGCNQIPATQSDARDIQRPIQRDIQRPEESPITPQATPHKRIKKECNTEEKSTGLRPDSLLDSEAKNGFGPVSGLTPAVVNEILQGHQAAQERYDRMRGRKTP